MMNCFLAPVRNFFRMVIGFCYRLCGFQQKLTTDSCVNDAIVVSIFGGDVIQIDYTFSRIINDRYYWFGPLEPIFNYYLYPSLEWHRRVRKADAEHLAVYRGGLSKIEEHLIKPAGKIIPGQFCLDKLDLVLVKNPNGLLLADGKAVNFNARVRLSAGSMVKEIGHQVTDESGATMVLCQLVDDPEFTGLLFYLEVKRVAQLQRLYRDLILTYWKNWEVFEQADVEFRLDQEQEKDQIRAVLAANVKESE